MVGCREWDQCGSGQGSLVSRNELQLVESTAGVVGGVDQMSQCVACL